MSVTNSFPMRGAGARRAALLLAGAAAVAFPDAPVFAQAANVGAPAPPVSEVTFTATARADSNVPRLNANQQNLRALDLSDVSVSPAILLNVERNVGRHRVGLQSRLGYRFYARNTQFNSEDISVSPFVNLDLPICDLYVQGSVSRRQSDLGELAYIVTPNPFLATDNKETRRGVTGRLTCGGAYGLRPTFEASYDRGDNSNPLRRFSDYRTTTIRPGLAYATPTLGELGVYAVKQTTDLPNQTGATGRQGGYTLRGGGISYARNVGTRLSLNGRVSFVDLTPRRGGTGSRSGLNYSVDGTLLVNPRWQVMGHAGRDFNSELTGFSTYDISEDYSLTITYVANPRLRFNLGGTISQRDYVFDVPPPVAFIRSQTTHTIFGGTSYELGRDLQLNIDGGYSTRSADLSYFDYDNYFVSIGLRYSLH